MLSKIKPSVAAIYFSIFALVVAMVSIGYHEPQELAAVANTTNVNALSQNDRTSVDNVVATSVAASVAKTVNLPIATSVANLAVSAQTKSEFTQSDGTSATKPQIIESSISKRSVTSYNVKPGDTVNSLAAKFKISAQTIKWANNLTTDALPVDKVLRILPFDGVIYSVKSGDTIESIAKKYGVDKTRIVTNNDLEESGLKSNTSIILPSAILPEEERPGYVAPYVAPVVTYYAGTGAGFGGQTWYIASGTPDDGPYSHGNCTLYAFNRRVQLGLPVGGNGNIPQWGNANSWAYLAGRAGLTVNNSPSAGAIMQNGGYLGHVAIVESIMPNGDLSISEMNAYVPGGGYNVVSGRIVPAGNIGQYLYIH
ncbi:LysM peptidoglycan-binding domain-containing protein [Candidatus Saccharibacteria bacterium]|nr:LysM peptidoglycan-binding domain-containing protein [Candidatus Saccharibacteria bacterium]